MKQKRIVLKYNKPNRLGHHREGEVYVALDYHSGGYPYQVTIDCAHDFNTVDEAVKYGGSYDFSVVELTVTYTEKVLGETMSAQEKQRRDEKARLEQEVANLQAKIRAL